MRRWAFDVIRREASGGCGRFACDSSRFDPIENIENIEDGIEFVTLKIIKIVITN